MDQRSSQRFVRAFIVVFAVAMVATAIFGVYVVRRTAVSAARADDDLRIVAWAVLVHADLTDGAFPASDSDLAGTPFAPTLEWRPEASAGAVPTTIGATGIDPVPSAADWGERLRIAVDRLDVMYPREPGPPTLTAAGRPTHHGVLDEVNGWIRRRADAAAGGR